MTDQTDQIDRRAVTTRRQLLRAASRQFARRPYHDVGLDDILADAELTKGAMYFHFRSKHALALAVVEEQLATDHAAVSELLHRRLSGLEALVDICFLMAVHDITRETARAVLHLVPVIGRTEGLQARLFADWVQTIVSVAERAIAEGDIIEGRSPQDVARLLVSLYVGLRQVADLDEPEHFLLSVEEGWEMVLPGIVPEDRIEYFGQFIKRRTALAIGSTSARMDG